MNKKVIFTIAGSALTIAGTFGVLYYINKKKALKNQNVNNGIESEDDKVTSNAYIDRVYHIVDELKKSGVLDTECTVYVETVLGLKKLRDEHHDYYLNEVIPMMTTILKANESFEDIKTFNDIIWNYLQKNSSEEETEETTTENLKDETKPVEE